MNNSQTNKRKIINDPVYGFISISEELIFDLIEHKYFQRLRRIKQLGLTNLVYPGALHTRFQHALGAYYLMNETIDVLRNKGVEISYEEELGVKVAILLHDIGHGPFSHSLENCIVHNINHEFLTEIFFSKLNNIFSNKLQTAISIFNNTYKKKFLHQLVSSQLDVDRLDYLTRDSFFTGVSEGIIGTERIIKMLNVFNDNLVVDIKGIYSIEKFLISRRLMYWQVYFHKTVISAEQLLIKVLVRAEYLVKNKFQIFLTPALKYFLENNFSKNDFIQNDTILDIFSQLDDDEIMTSIKMWQNSNDKILSILSNNLINRKLFKVEIFQNKIDKTFFENLKKFHIQNNNINENEINYFVFEGAISNSSYSKLNQNISILNKDNTCKDISELSEHLNSKSLNYETKYFVCYPK